MNAPHCMCQGAETEKVCELCLKKLKEWMEGRIDLCPYPRDVKGGISNE